MPGCHRLRRWFPVVAATALAMQHAAGKDPMLRPEEIHKQVSPCVAMIRDIDSHGSGVVVSRDGLILTNYHVVASGLPLSISVKVRKGNDWVEKTFDDVVVSKVHPEYDLALLKIDAADGAFQAAKLLGADGKVVTGSPCFAIGNPGGTDGGALERSITEGLVSASSRQIEGLDYIQTSAALNPGNSGGAVCDSQGRVIGIATLRLEQADNIGFAIPVRNLKLDQFIPLERRKPNPDLAMRYETEANRIAGVAEQMEGDERAWRFTSPHSTTGSPWRPCRTIRLPTTTLGRCISDFRRTRSPAGISNARCKSGHCMRLR